MSGGIDSAVAALLMIQEGYAVSGATMQLCEKKDADGKDLTANDIADAKEVCNALGISHKVYAFKKEFHDTVIRDFIDTYLDGGTPNPCIVCNRLLKFGLLLDKEIEQGADYVATGHYAQIEQRVDGRFLLKKAADTQKDQSYMLWSLSQHQLAHTIFPLGKLSKPEIRQMGADHGFVIAHKSDSQDICFVPDGDYASFIEKEIGYTYPSGIYVDETGKVLGKHKGIIHYTIGQRKGLGISMGRHIFVTQKDAETNTVILADEDKLFTNKVVIKKINLIPFDHFDGIIRLSAKIRYRHEAAPCTAEITGQDEITLSFDEPQRAPAKGQSAVLYDGDYVVGGGIIC